MDMVLGAADALRVRGAAANRCVALGLVGRALAVVGSTAFLLRKFRRAFRIQAVLFPLMVCTFLVYRDRGGGLLIVQAVGGAGVLLSWFRVTRVS